MKGSSRQQSSDYGRLPMTSRMTLVSSSPRPARSLTEQTLVDGCIEVTEESFGVDRCVSGEHRHHLSGRDECSSAKRVQLRDRGPVASHHERRSPFNGTQNRPGIVAQFALGDLTGCKFGHELTLPQDATECYSRVR